MGRLDVAGLKRPNTHPIAEIFPLMTDAEFVRLADDIEANGLLDPITLLDGTILDGRHRQRACEERGVEPRYAEWDEVCGITPLEWVISKNLQRRQLTTAQRAALAVEYEPQLAEAARQRKIKAGREIGRGQKVVPKSAQPNTSPRSGVIAATTFGVGHSTVSGLKAVKAVSPDVFEQVKTGALPISAARKLVGLHRLGSNAPAPNTRIKLKEVLDPLHKYLKNWHEDRLTGVFPREARQLLKVVQEIDRTLLEVERALEERTVVSRALR